MASRARGARPASPSAPTPTRVNHGWGESVVDGSGVSEGSGVPVCSNDMAFRVVILGGTSEGRELAERLASDPRYAVILSFAGRTRSLQLPSAPYRVGGFGGVD